MAHKGIGPVVGAQLPIAVGDPGRLPVRGQLPVTGEWVELRTDAFEAVALQHEIDHTQGLLFLDRVRGADDIHPRRTYL